MNQSGWDFLCIQSIYFHFHLFSFDGVIDNRSIIFWLICVQGSQSSLCIWSKPYNLRALGFISNNLYFSDSRLKAISFLTQFLISVWYLLVGSFFTQFFFVNEIEYFVDSCFFKIIMKLPLSALVPSLIYSCYFVKPFPSLQLNFLWYY